MEDLEYIPNLQDLFENGQIAENTYLFFDYVRQKYFVIAKDQRWVLADIAAEHFLIEKMGSDIKNPKKILKQIKKVRVVFDITKPRMWEDELGTCFNEFEEDVTKFQQIKEIRETTKERYSNFEELQQKTPAIAALLYNLLEEDPNAILHFINWFASFMHTKQKPHTAFLFSSVEGAGKGVLTDTVLRHFFSAKYQTSLLASTLKGNFNGSLENKLLVNFNEVTSDFHKTDMATQTLKSLITDDTFLLNVKGQKELVVKNNFLIILSQNNANGVKISINDRRFNYFNPKRPLVRVAEDDFDMDISDFIEKIKDELDDFVEYIALYNYNTKTVNKLYETESKRRTVLATSNASDVFFEMIKQRKIDELNEEIIELHEIFMQQSPTEYNEKYTAVMLKIVEIMTNVREDFNKGFITNNNLIALYTILVAGGSIQNKIDDRKIKKILDSNFDKAVPKYVATTKKTERVRILCSEEDVEKEAVKKIERRHKELVESGEVPF